MVDPFKSWSRYLSQWSRLVIKAACPLCQRPANQAFCANCWQQLQRCQLPQPTWSTTTGLPVFAWGRYGNPVKRAIAAMKYHNQPDLAVPLGSWLAHAWNRQPELGKGAIVVPIPMHCAKQQERGFNQAELLAESFCAVTRLPLERRGLERMRETSPQFRLSQGDRVQNLQSAFCLGSAFRQRSPKRPVLLLDDIYTTGATAQSAAQTLRSHGIRVQGIVVVAISERDRES